MAFYCNWGEGKASLPGNVASLPVLSKGRWRHRKRSIFHSTERPGTLDQLIVHFFSPDMLLFWQQCIALQRWVCCTVPGSGIWCHSHYLYLRREWDTGLLWLAFTTWSCQMWIYWCTHSDRTKACFLYHRHLILGKQFIVVSPKSGTWPFCPLSLCKTTPVRSGRMWRCRRADLSAASFPRLIQSLVSQFSLAISPWDWRL